MGLQENLQNIQTNLLSAKTAIAQSITAKGVECSATDKLSTFATKIDSISGGSTGGTGEKFVVPDGMKFGYSTAFDPSLFDVSNVTNMSYMFYSAVTTNTNIAKQSIDSSFGENSSNQNEYYSYWFFSPYRNYGYATTGFGYLRNISVYTQKETSVQDSETTDEDAVENVAKSYSYTRLSISDANNIDTVSVYFAIPNIGKFKQIVEASGDGSNMFNNYFLMYDMNLNSFEKSDSWTGAQTLGESGETIYIDGREHIIEFDNSVGLFSTAFADIENLRIIANDYITSSNYSDNDNTNYYGVLAGQLNGSLNNVTVEGNIAASSSTSLSLSNENIIGGVVGDMTGTVTAVQNLVNIRVSDGSNIIGGVVGDLVESNSSISYSSNAGNIISDKSAANQNNSGETITVDSNKIKIQNIVGGIVGRIKDNSVNYSYNTSSIMNGYANSTRNVGNVVAGGIVGVSISGTVLNSFNTGYIVAGNNGNNYAALAGGITGYSTGSVNNCVNDAKVQAVSELYPNDYTITVTKKSNEIDQSSHRITNPAYIYDVLIRYTISVEYNTSSPNRLVYAYGLGYSNNNNAGSFGNNKNYCEDIINDGNLGKISTSKTFSRYAYRYGGYNSYFLANSENYGIVDYITFGENKISGYDSFGFPSRINSLYTYRFDFTAWEFDTGLADNIHNGVLHFTITDSNENGNADDISITGSKIDVRKNHSEDFYTNGIPEVYPGGETERYFSLPFYGENASDNFTYESYVDKLNSLSSNISNLNENDFSGAKDNLNTLFEHITQATTGTQPTSNININGSIFTNVDRNSDFSGVVSGYEISGRISLGRLDIGTIGEYFNASNSYSTILNSGNFNIDNISLIKVDSNGNEDVAEYMITNDDGSSVSAEIKPLFYQTRLSTDGSGNYYIDYSIYYSTALLEAEDSEGNSCVGYNLKVDIDYTINYQVQGTVTLTGSNLDVYYDRSDDRYYLKIYNLSSDNNIASFGEDLHVGQSYTAYVTYTTEDDQSHIIDTTLMIGSETQGNSVILFGYIESYVEDGSTIYLNSEQEVIDLAEKIGNGDMQLNYEVEIFVERQISSEVSSGVIQIDSTEEITYDLPDTLTEDAAFDQIGEFSIENGNGIYTIDTSNYSKILFDFVGASSDTGVSITRNGESYIVRVGGTILSAGNNTSVNLGSSSVTVENVGNGIVRLIYGGATSASDIRSIMNSISATLISSSITLNKTLSDYEMYNQDGVRVTADLTLDVDSIDDSLFDISDNGTSVTVTEKVDADVENITVSYNVENLDDISPVISDDRSYQVEVFNSGNSISIIYINNQIQAFANLNDGEYYPLEIRDSVDGTSYLYSEGSYIGFIDAFNGRSYIRTEVTFDNYNYASLIVDYTNNNYKISTYVVNTTVNGTEGVDFQYIIVENLSTHGIQKYVYYNGVYYTATFNLDEKIFISDFGISSITFSTSGSDINSINITFNAILDLQDANYDGISGLSGDFILDKTEDTGGYYYVENNIQYEFAGSLTSTFNASGLSNLAYQIIVDNDSGSSTLYNVEIIKDNSQILSEYLLNENYLNTYYLIAISYEEEETTSTGEGGEIIVTGINYNLTFDQDLLNDLSQNYTESAGIRFVQIGGYELVSAGIHTFDTSLYYGSDTITVQSNIKDFENNDFENDIFDNFNSLTIDDGAEISTDNDKATVTFTKVDDLCGVYEYDYSLVATYNFTYNSDITENVYSIESDENDIRNDIILTNNIMYDNSIYISDKRIFADNYIITILNNGITNSNAELISVSDSAYLSNTSVVAVGSVSGFTASGVKDISYISTGDISNIENLKLYGSIRNIDWHVNDMATSVILLEKASADSNSTSISITSYASLIGADADKVKYTNSDEIQYVGVQNRKANDGNSIGVTLNEVRAVDATNEYDISIDSSSYSILIGGNASNGVNGADGDTSDGIFAYTRYGNDGSSGGNGGEGGHTELLKSGLNIDGIDGKGGTGGNGGDGANASAKVGMENLASSRYYNGYYAGGGGAGGNYGRSGDDEANKNNGHSNRNFTCIAGSGGSGGLGVVYYNSKVEDGYKNGETFGEGKNGWSDNLYYDDADEYYSETDNFVSWIETAAGGGASGGDPDNTSTPGSYGYFLTSASGNVFIRDKGKAAAVSYYWLSAPDESSWFFGVRDTNIYNERIFGNLQLITTFSSWRADASDHDNKGCTNYDDKTTDIYETRFKNFLRYEGFNCANGYTGYDIWKYYFCGGDAGVAGNDSAVSGSRSYTTEIYGYFSKICQDGKNFMTRNDMVTQGGHFGEAKGLNRTV